MTTFSFSGESGNTIAFDVALDSLEFDAGDSPAAVQITQQGLDVSVSTASESVLLTGVTIAELMSTNFTFTGIGDLLLGGLGNDTFATGAGDDYFGLEDGGDDSVSAGSGDDIFHMGSSLSAGDSLDGGAGDADVMTVSGDFSVTMTGTTVTGIEEIRGGDGIISIGISDSAATTSTGRLFVNASTQSEGSSIALDGSAVSAQDMIFLSGDGDDTLTGGSGNDELTSGDGADAIEGGAGDDTIVGGLGADTMTGGAGDDAYRFGFATGSRTESSPNIPDLITDFEGAGTSGGDIIDLPTFNNGGTPLAFNTSAAGFEYTGPSSGAQDGANAGDGFVDVFWRFDTSDNQFVVWVDANDDGLFSEEDLRMFLQRASGETSTTLALSDFADNFLVWRGTSDDETYTAETATIPFTALAATTA